MNILGLLGVLFVALKLIGIIDWSWWWVLLPFYGGLAFFVSLALLLYSGAWMLFLGKVANNTLRGRITIVKLFGKYRTFGKIKK